MKTPERAGWYDDPEDSTRLRYFDGIVWTDNTVGRGPRVPPTSSTPPAASEPTDPAARDAGGARPPFAPPPTGPPATDVYGRPTQPQTHPQTAAPGTTDDGVPLAGYGQRAVAFLIDSAILTIITLLAAGWAFWRFMEDYWGYVRDLATTNPATAEVPSVQEVSGMLDYEYFFVAIAIMLVIQAVYGIGFLVARGATPGKMMLGISVRRVDRPGPIGVGTAFMRMLLPLGMRVLWSFTCLVELVLRVIDLVWPLRNPRRQALHDRIAGTQVVVGRRAPAPEAGPGA